MDKNFENIYKKIDNLINDLLKLQAKCDNPKRINDYINTIISNLNEMEAFFKELENLGLIIKFKNNNYCELENLGLIFKNNNYCEFCINRRKFTNSKECINCVHNEDIDCKGILNKFKKI